MSKLMPDIKKVIFNPPATIVLWTDSTKTVVKAGEGQEFSEEVGLAEAIAKKYAGNRSRFKKMVEKRSGFNDDLGIAYSTSNLERAKNIVESYHIAYNDVTTIRDTIQHAVKNTNGIRVTI